MLTQGVVLDRRDDGADIVRRRVIAADRDHRQRGPEQHRIVEHEALCLLDARRLAGRQAAGLRVRGESGGLQQGESKDEGGMARMAPSYCGRPVRAIPAPRK